MVGKLEVIHGSMFCGKTEELIRRLRRYMIISKVYCFKPAIDNRYSKSAIASHNLTLFDSEPVSTSSMVAQLMESVAPPAVVGIDEVQMFDDGILTVIDDLLLKGFDVIAAGLDTDFSRKPFNIVTHLIGVSDESVKLYAICMKCHGKATKSYRKTKDVTERIAVGGSEMYEARCSPCHRLQD